jgi:hypothetical protein
MRQGLTSIVRDLHVRIKEMYTHMRETELKKEKKSLNNVKKL